MSARTPETDAFRVLFVCTGNTCRSPMAEALARREVASLGWKGVEVGSAGAAAVEGAAASAEAVAVAKRNGLDLSGHRSTPLTQELVDESDLILVMSPSHLTAVAQLGGEGRMALLGAFAEGSEGFEGPLVPDPFGRDEEVYAETFRTLEDLVGRSLRRLEPVVAP